VAGEHADRPDLKERVISKLPLDAGHPRSPATMLGSHHGRVEITGTLERTATFPPRDPEPVRYEVVALVAFDDVGTQPITRFGYTLDLVDDPKPGDRVTVDTGPHLIVRRS
jgi:hypothetical protein